MTRTSSLGLIFLAILGLWASFCRGDDTQDIPSPVETILIPGVTFTMGTPLKKDDEKYKDNERPLEVTVKDFKIGKYSVTAEQMCLFLNSEEAKKHDRQTLFNAKDIGEYKYSTIELSTDGQYIPRKKAAKAPAMPVTWMGAVLYCAWLSEKNGKNYRLPSEAEWELAAGGKEKRPWPWGTDAPTLKMGARYTYSQETANDVLIRGAVSALLPRRENYWETVSVGTYPANATPEGAQDFLAFWMVEWCANKYVPHPTPEQATNTGIDLDDLRARRAVRGCPIASYKKKGMPWYLRGTEYAYSNYPGRLWTRASYHPKEDAYGGLGFRVVEELRKRTLH